MQFQESSFATFFATFAGFSFGCFLSEELSKLSSTDLYAGVPFLFGIKFLDVLPLFFRVSSSELSSLLLLLVLLLPSAP